MAIISIRCSYCGGNVEFDESREFMFCTYCGTKMIRDDIKIQLDSSAEIKSKIEVAKISLANGQYVKAMESADSALALDSSVSDGWFIKSIAVKNTNNSFDAPKYYETAKKCTKSFGIFTEEDYLAASPKSEIHVRWKSTMGSSLAGGVNIILDSDVTKMCSSGKSVTFKTIPGEHNLAVIFMGQEVANAKVKCEEKPVYYEFKRGMTSFSLSKTNKF